MAGKKSPSKSKKSKKIQQAEMVTDPLLMVENKNLDSTEQSGISFTDLDTVLDDQAETGQISQSPLLLAAEEIDLPELPKNKTVLTLAVGLAVVAFVSMGAYFVYPKFSQSKKEHSAESQTKASAPVSEEEKNLETLTALSRLIVLPEGEQPFFARVSDASKLKDQNFFALAQNGDALIIYQQAKKAFLFRDSEGKIIEAAPFIQDVKSQDSRVLGAKSAKESVKKISVEIRNGSGKTGEATKAKEKIAGLNGIGDIKTGNGLDLTGDNLIIFKNPANAEIAQQILQLISGRIAPDLPVGEKQFGSDILIILGKK